MNDIRAAFTYAKFNFYKWKCNYKVFAIFLILILFLMSILLPLRNMLLQLALPITPWIFPFLMSNKYVSMIIYILYLFLLSDAPFTGAEFPYAVVRKSQRTWLWGQLVYIMLSSVLYFAVVLFISVIVFCGYLQIQSDWGSVLYSLGQSNLAETYQITLGINPEILVGYTPVGALLCCFTISLLSGTSMGCMFFLLRLIGKTVLSYLPFVMVFLNFFLIRAHYLVVYISPATWSNLSVINPININTPSIYYVYETLIAINVITVLMCSRFVNIELIQNN